MALTLALAGIPWTEKVVFGALFLVTGLRKLNGVWAVPIRQAGGLEQAPEGLGRRTWMEQSTRCGAGGEAEPGSGSPAFQCPGDCWKGLEGTAGGG